MALLVSCAAAADLPTSVDLRPQFARFGLIPKRQGARGTCSVFAMTGVLEYEYALAGARAAKLSEEYLNWASHQSNGRDTDGTFFADGLRGLWMLGVCRSTLLPYRKDFDPDLVPPAAAIAEAASRRDISGRWIKRWNPRTGMTDRMLRLMKQSLAEGHPVAIGLRWPKQEEYAAGDVLVVPRASEVFDGHSVILVGYDDDTAQPGGGTFIFRNHAGPTWRQQGHARLPYAYVRAFGNDALGLRIGGGTVLPSNRTAAHPREAEELEALAHDGCSSAMQDMKPWGARLWSAGRQLFCSGGEGARLALALPIERPGHYRLNLYATRAPDFGTVQVSLDGKPLGEPLDLYGREVLPTGQIGLGDVRLQPGRHELAIRVVGKAARSRGWAFGVDCVELVPKED
ncbi:MAG: C1 family peptidase [Armatimonadetes bacterium]|nr:C1 family peptidase [Armatimonadota bacterium]